jgi:hypothetical protein
VNTTGRSVGEKPKPTATLESPKRTQAAPTIRMLLRDINGPLRLLLPHRGGHGSGLTKCHSSRKPNKQAKAPNNVEYVG